MDRNIENQYLKVSVATHGAEMMSFYNKKNQKEYLWDGKKEFWGRRSPVLFPFVGAVKGKQYQYKGNTYPMGQHGFARDMEFELLSYDTDEIWFELKDSDQTWKVYPFSFSLQIGYRLEKNSIRIMWRVYNQGEEEMYFSIGAHPAFVCPLGEGERNDMYLYLDAIKSDVELSVIDASCGLIGGKAKLAGLEEQNQGSYIKISDELFEKDALIFENHQTQKIALCTPDKLPYVTVDFDAPLAGVWSPAGKNAPFVCIEPWYGRCDAIDFQGELSERDWSNTLAPSCCFEAAYRITVE